MEEISLLELALEALQNSALVVLVANVLTLFVDDAKLSKGAPFVGAVGKFLNLLALNIGSNQNKDA